MTEKARSVVEVRFSDGSTISAWQSVDIRQNYLDPLGSYRFQLAPPPAKREEYRKKLAKGERVTVHIDGAQQATCLIVTRDETIGDGGYVLSVEAKSPLVTPHQASVDPYVAKRLQSEVPMSNLVLEVLGPYGFDAIVTDTTADVVARSGRSVSGRKPHPTATELKHQESEAQPGESAYGFCARHFTRVGLVLRCDFAGDLLLGSPDYDQDSVYTLVQDRTRGNAGDRMLRNPPIQIHDTNDNQFSEVVCVGRSADRRNTKSASTPIGGVANDAGARPSSAPFPNAKLRRPTTGLHSYSSTPHPFKPKYRIDKKTPDLERCQNVAELLHGVRAAQAFTIRCAVDGLKSVSGDRVWAVDTVGRIIIEDLGFDEKMWLLEANPRVDRRGGQMTQLTWIPLGSLVLGEVG